MIARLLASSPAAGVGVRAAPAGRFLTLAGAAAVAFAASVLPGVAHAQESETTLITPAVPEGFDRDRNISVTDRARPDYDPLGIPYRGFNVFPRVDLGVGITSNAYLTTDSAKVAPFAYLQPSIRAQSDWSRNEVVLSGNAQLVGYAGASRRNTDTFDLSALGRYDVGGYSAVTGEAQLSRQFETPFSGEVASDIAVISSYLRNFESVRGQYQASRLRGILALDHTGFTFGDIDFSNGKISQANRDRNIYRVTGQGEYAISPSASVYTQVAVGFTDYSDPLAPGVPNRDSTGVRVIAGLDFDIAALARGTVGIGYIHRNYYSPIYPDVGGVSVEGRVQYFPTELTTFTLNLRRVIEDSNIGSTSAFFDNRVSLRIDHELLRNLLLNLIGEFARQDYIDTDLTADVYRVATGARYLVNRRFAIEADLAYTTRSTSGLIGGAQFDEFRGQIGITLQR